APSVLVPKGVAVKLCRVVKVCAVTRPAGSKLSTAISAGRTRLRIKATPRQGNRFFVFILSLLLLFSRCFNSFRVRSPRQKSSAPRRSIHSPARDSKARFGRGLGSG